MSVVIEQLNYYFKQLNVDEQESVLHLIETIAKGKNHLNGPISVEQYNAELDEALAEAERGETVSHEEVVALSKKW